MLVVKLVLSTCKREIRVPIGFLWCPMVIHEVQGDGAAGGGHASAVAAVRSDPMN